jgi:hypothetical protein
MPVLSPTTVLRRTPVAANVTSRGLLRPKASTGARHPHSPRVSPHATTSSLILPQLEPVLEQVSAFSPATVANLGAGFDFMGCAVEVTAHPCADEERASACAPLDSARAGLS